MNVIHTKKNFLNFPWFFRLDENKDRPYNIQSIRHEIKNLQVKKKKFKLNFLYDKNEKNQSDFTLAFETIYRFQKLFVGCTMIGDYLHLVIWSSAENWTNAEANAIQSPGSISSSSNLCPAAILEWHFKNISLINLKKS